MLSLKSTKRVKFPAVENTLAAGTSVLIVVASKLCCWGPVLATLFGSASYLVWLSPMKPYLTVAALLSLGYSHYKASNQKKNNAVACHGCAPIKRTGFFHSKTWLWLLTFLVMASLAFSYWK